VGPRVAHDLLRGAEPVDPGHAQVHQDDVRLELPCELDRLGAVACATDDLDALVRRQQYLERLGEEGLVIGDEDAHGRITYVAVEDGARTKIQKLLLTGDNRLKQGVDAAKVRESYEQALAVAREAGLEDSVRPLVEIRLADLDRLAGGSPPPEPPAA
jgi:hypothetical protein